MLRTASSSIARTALRHNSRGAGAALAQPQSFAFHASIRREEEAEKAPVESKGGLFGTGINEWYALPVGLAAAIPIVKYDWYIINEETQLMAAFIAFCVVVKTQGGEAIHQALDAKAQALLKENREAEQEIIDNMEELVDHLGNQLEIPEIMEDMNKMRVEAYGKLNAAGTIKPKHDLKAQVERVLNMLAQEETTVTDKMKSSLMAEATAAVTDQFATSKALKKAALDDAIANIKGGAGGADPVQAAFVKFFKDKSAAAAKTKDDSEEKAQRAAFLAKANAVAQSEGYFFRFDDNGMPKMAA